MDISDIENDVESIEEDSSKWVEKKKKIESKEQSIQNALEKLREDVEMTSKISEYQNKVLHEKEALDEQRTKYSQQIEKIKQDLSDLIAETEASRSVISELEAIGENVEESLQILEERQQLIDESTVQLQEVISRLGLAKYDLENTGSTSFIEKGTEYNVPAESTAQNTLREYMYNHDYTELDYMTYSQDPEWRVLQSAADPEYPLPPMSKEDAFSKLGEYFRSHNYGQEDFDVYSRDPVWQELQKYAYPGSIPVLVKPKKEYATNQYKTATNSLEKVNVDYHIIKPYGRFRSSEEIIKDLGGHDITIGSCSSLAFAYAGNRAGFDVLDYRDGNSCYFFGSDDSIEMISGLSGINSIVHRDTNDFKAADTLLQKIESVKEYYFATGKHAAVVRKRNEKYEYLELQHTDKEQNGWKELNKNVLKKRFGCKAIHYHKRRNFLIDIDSLSKSQEFLDLLGYINTSK